MVIDKGLVTQDKYLWWLHYFHNIGMFYYEVVVLKLSHYSSITTS